MGRTEWPSASSPNLVTRPGGLDLPVHTTQWAVRRLHGLDARCGYARGVDGHILLVAGDGIAHTTRGREVSRTGWPGVRVCHVRRGTAGAGSSEEGDWSAAQERADERERATARYGPTMDAISAGRKIVLSDRTWDESVGLASHPGASSVAREGSLRVCRGFPQDFGFIRD